MTRRGVPHLRGRANRIECPSGPHGYPGGLWSCPGGALAATFGDHLVAAAGRRPQRIVHGDENTPISSGQARRRQDCQTKPRGADDHQFGTADSTEEGADRADPYRKGRIARRRREAQQRQKHKCAAEISTLAPRASFDEVDEKTACADAVKTTTM